MATSVTPEIEVRERKNDAERRVRAWLALRVADSSCDVLQEELGYVG